MRREPLLLPVVAFAAGVLTGHFFFFTVRDLALPCLTAVCVCTIACFCSPYRLRLASFCILLGVCGICAQVLHRPGRAPRLNADDAEVVLLSGCVTDPGTVARDREQFTLQLAQRAAARISINLRNEATPAVDYGQLVEVAAKVRVPRNYQNPGAFDYAGYLAQQHIYWLGSVASPSDVRVLRGSCGYWPVAMMYRIRRWALARLQALYPSDPHTAGLLAATLLGETSGVDRRWTEDFRSTGTYHALVISGLHISIVAMTLLILFRLLSVRRLPGLAIAAAVCWFYACISGFNSPAVRSAAGFTLFVTAAFFFRKTRPLNLLAVIGFIYLVFDPDQLFDPAFQLSFLSVATIAAFAVPAMERFTDPLRASTKYFDQSGYDPHVETRAARWRVELRLLAETLRSWTGLTKGVAYFIVASCTRVAAFAFDGVIVSACIQFGLALPMIAYFHRLSATGLSANVLVVPLLSAVIPLGFASIVSGWHPIAALTKLFLDWAEVLTSWHVRFEPLWRIATVPLWIAIAFSLSLIGLAVVVRRKPRLIAPSLAVSLGLFALIFAQPWKPAVHPGALELTAIDVGQGDSLLVVFPNGQTMLVDAGGFPGAGRMTRKPQMDVGEDVVSPYLWTRRIHRLDYAVLTHGHSDHMDGLPAVLDNFRPSALWIGAEPETREWKRVEEHAAADHVRIVPLHRSPQPIDIGGAQIRVLAPAPDYTPGEQAVNDDSLVLEIAYGSRSILLTGDAERPIENDMIASAGLRPVTLLKVGHHGSRTSSSEAFLDEVKPQFAFISDGYKNQFHHPHPDVLARLAEHHIETFRTDERGLLTFRTDGEHVTLTTFR